MLGFGHLGQFALGQASSVEPILVAETGAFTFTGNDAALRLNTVFEAETGSFAFTGNDVSFTITGYPDKIRVFPRVGSGPRALPLTQGGIVARTSAGRGMRARAFGG